MLMYPEKGQERYEWLVETRLLAGSKESIWDPLPQLKLKRFSNYMPKTTVKVGSKTYKLREDGKFSRKCLILARSRPELLAKLDTLIGFYELSVYPRTLFVPNETLIIPNDKAKLMNYIISKQPIQPYQEPAHNAKKVLVSDAMSQVQALKKTPTTTKMVHLKRLFIMRIKRKIDRYGESRILFDTYKELSDFSQKDGARIQRGQDVNLHPTNQDFEIHDEMSLKKTQLRELLSSISVKRRLTKYFAEAILEEYKGDASHVVYVSFGTTIAVNEPHVIGEHFKSHRHEEADTQIPLHILHSFEVNAAQHSTPLHFDVISVDTDVLIILMDLVSHGYLNTSTRVTLHAGKGRNVKTIDIMERIRCIGVKKARAFLVFMSSKEVIGVANL